MTESDSVVMATKKISEMEKLDGFCSVIAEILRIPKFDNESDVREDFLIPLLKVLGYSNTGKNKIERNIFLDVPELIVGKKKKSMEKYSPDYVLSVNGVRRWLIDAKRPSESVRDEANISQAYSYAIHREINVPYFIVCNGEELAIYNTADQGYKAYTVFKRYELDYRWQELNEMLSAEAFRTRLSLVKGNLGDREKIGKKVKVEQDFEKPISRVIVPRKQASCIHRGTHPYFTKRAWNVVREYVEHFTKNGEVVLDPFGGSGVTAIESFLVGRKAIHVDINPIANFMAEALAQPVDIHKMSEVYEKLATKFQKKFISRGSRKSQTGTPTMLSFPRMLMLNTCMNTFHSINLQRCHICWPR